jgi:hypothetical protein
MSPQLAPTGGSRRRSIVPAIEVIVLQKSKVATRTRRVDRSTHEVAMDFGRPANVK